jgi:hypothetical protein
MIQIKHRQQFFPVIRLVRYKSISSCREKKITGNFFCLQLDIDRRYTIVEMFN